MVSVPLPLRYWMSSSQALTAQMHTIIRTTIAQYYVNQAVKRGVERQQVQPGSVTFIQRFGGALNLNVHFHCIFLEDVYLDRAEAGLKPRFVKGEPPSDADIAEVAQTISRHVIRKLRHLGYLEAGSDAAGSTGYDPLMVDEPALAGTLALALATRVSAPR
jgi:putative transposase